MTRSHRKAIGLFALAILGALPGCEAADRLESITSPTIAYDQGSNSGSNSGNGKRAELLRRLQTRLGDEMAMVESNRSGGELVLGGHKLVIPKRAVTRRTTFAMRLVPGDYIEVQLFAWDSKTFRPVRQFERPVKLVLSYADASPKDENKLGVAYLPDNTPLGRQEKMGGTSVDKIRKTVSALLPHFSEFAITAN
jgi:hypothetical protein